MHPKIGGGNLIINSFHKQFKLAMIEWQAWGRFNSDYSLPHSF